MEMTTKTQKSKENFADKDTHNILRLLNIWPNFPFSPSEIKYDY